MSLTLITAPTVNPLSLDEAKNHLKIDDDLTDDDALVQALIVSVRTHLDGYSGILGRAMTTQTWRLDISSFREWIDIPLPPLQSISSVKYYDTNGTLQTVATTVYETILGGTSGGYVHLLGDQTWPTDMDTDRAEPIQITFVAGYGDSWNDVPEGLRLAMSMMVADLYENRGERLETAMMENTTVDRMLAPYRLHFA